MAEAATIARPYAEAVFGLADKAGAFAKWLGMLATMARVAAHPDMRSCISNPNLGAKQLRPVHGAVQGGFSQRRAELRARADRERPSHAAAGDPPAVHRAEKPARRRGRGRDPHRLSAEQRADHRPRRGHL